MDLGTPLQRSAVERFMPYSFIETNELAKRFQKEERRHVYSTPKSFLEMLKLYQVLLEHKRDTSDYSIGRLKAGLQKMQETADAVAEIEAGLKITLEDAEVKKTKAEGIAEVSLGVLRCGGAFTPSTRPRVKTPRRGPLRRCPRPLFS